MLPVFAYLSGIRAICWHMTIEKYLFPEKSRRNKSSDVVGI